MSRGLGSLQQLILEQLDHDRPTQMNELCWRLATQTGRFTIERGSSVVDRSFYAGFLRAIGALGQRVVRSRRKLMNLNELVAYYPFKTRSRSMKELRQRLLPVVVDWLSQQNAARFRRAQTEHHLLDRLPATAQAEASESWAVIEDRVFDAMCRLHGDSRLALLSILVKGRELFVHRSGVSEHRSLGILIDQGVRSESLSEYRQLLSDVKRLYEHCLPAAKVNHAWLKSQLYSIASYSRWGPTSQLSDEIKGVLLDRDREFVEGLPGHVPEHLQRVGNLTIPRKVEYSAVLNELLRRDVLGPFEFVSSAAS